jgi:hypothetical protein
MQLSAIAAILSEYGVSTDGCPPVVVLLAMTGTAAAAGRRD